MSGPDARGEEVYFSPATRELYREVRRTSRHVWYTRTADGREYVGFVPIREWECYYATLPRASS
jgi:hypothetical protein